MVDGVVIGPSVVCRLIERGLGLQIETAPGEVSRGYGPALRRIGAIASTRYCCGKDALGPSAHSVTHILDLIIQ